MKNCPWTPPRDWEPPKNLHCAKEAGAESAGLFRKKFFFGNPHRRNPNIGFIRRFQWDKRKRGMVSHSPPVRLSE